MLQAPRASAACPSLLGSGLRPSWGRAKLDPHLARQGAADTRKRQHKQPVTVHADGSIRCTLSFVTLARMTDEPIQHFTVLCLVLFCLFFF